MVLDQLPPFENRIEGVAEVASYKIPVAACDVHTMALYFILRLVLVSRCRIASRVRSKYIKQPGRSNTYYGSIYLFLDGLIFNNKLPVKVHKKHILLIFGNEVNV